MEPVVIRVFWDPVRTSRNKIEGCHWGTKQRLARDARMVAHYGWVAAGSPVASGPVVVDFEIHRPRKIDIGTALDGLKWVIDALFQSRLDVYGRGITPDDGPDWLTYGEVSFVTNREETFVLVSVRENVDSHEPS